MRVAGVVAGYGSMGAEAGLVLHVLYLGWGVDWAGCVFERLCLISEDVVKITDPLIPTSKSIITIRYRLAT